jgi:hypothetical protein
MRTVSSAEMLPTCWCIRPSLFPGSADVPHTPCHPSFKADQCIDSTTGLRSISLTNPLAGWRLWISACHPLPDPILEDFLTTCTSPVQLMPSISSSSVCSRKPHAGARHVATAEGGDTESVNQRSPKGSRRSAKRSVVLR